MLLWLLTNSCFTPQGVLDNYPDSIAVAFEHLHILMAFPLPMLMTFFSYYVHWKRGIEREKCYPGKWNWTKTWEFSHTVSLICSLLLFWTELYQTRTKLYYQRAPCMAELADRSKPEMLWRPFWFSDQAKCYVVAIYYYVVEETSFSLCC